MVNENTSVIADVEICSNGRTISCAIFDASVCFRRLFSLLSEYKSVFIIIDKNATNKSSYIRELKDCLRDFPTLEIQANEHCKTMDSVLDICKWLLDQGADRDAFILGIGGGITLDMTGFAASIYKRGVRFAYVPTTLLAQVDAAIGGKTGVNFDKYKNILGIIRQPEFTYLNINLLLSLSRRDFLSGAAEMLKTFIIEDNGNYCRAVRFIRENIVNDAYSCCDDGFSFTKNQKSELLALVAASVSVKAGVVSRDQFESGERRLLNLGHTFAHAIETLSRHRNADNVSGSWDISHGEAVAIGIIQAARLTESLARNEKTFFCSNVTIKQGFADRIEDDFRSCGLPVACPFTIKEMAPIMAKDKKAEGGIIHFVLPLSIGHVVAYDLSVDNVVEALPAISNVAIIE